MWPRGRSRHLLEQPLRPRLLGEQQQDSTEMVEGEEREVKAGSRTSARHDADFAISIARRSERPRRSLASRDSQPLGLVRSRGRSAGLPFSGESLYTVYST